MESSRRRLLAAIALETTEPVQRSLMIFLDSLAAGANVAFVARAMAQSPRTLQYHFLRAGWPPPQIVFGRLRLLFAAAIANAEPATAACVAKAVGCSPRQLTILSRRHMDSSFRGLVENGFGSLTPQGANKVLRSGAVHGVRSFQGVVTCDD